MKIFINFLKDKLKLLLEKNNFIYKIVRKIYLILINTILENFSGSNKDIFTEIYKKNKWGDKYSYSGSGSNIKQTKNILIELPKVIRKYEITSILDLPCGDFYWMKEYDFKNLEYIGADIVSALVEQNIKKFSSENIKFMNLDIIINNLPCSDLLFCRDCLVHFSFDDIFQALKNIKRSKFKYLMTTNFLKTGSNINIPTGSWRTINLCKPPFNFPDPIENIIENCTEGDNKFSDKVLSLWMLKSIPDYL
tara:strand:- start:356 stop:1105 length:750 start_codon:yes stop_codon:yes gene_type:complete